MPSPCPSSRRGNAAVTSAPLLAMSMAPAAACTIRQAMSASADGANPATTLITVNSPTPVRYISRRPMMSARRPNTTISTVLVSMNDSRIHWAWVAVASKCRAIVGSAMLMELLFSPVISPARQTNDSTRQA